MAAVHTGWYVAAAVAVVALLALAWRFRRRDVHTVRRLDGADDLEAAVLRLTELDTVQAYRGGDDVEIPAGHVVELVTHFDRDLTPKVAAALARDLQHDTDAAGAEPLPLRPATRLDVLTDAVGVRVRDRAHAPAPGAALRGEEPGEAPTHLLVLLAGPTVERWMTDAVDGLAARQGDRLAADAMAVAGRTAARHFQPLDPVEAARRVQQLAGDATAGTLAVTAAATPVDTDTSVVRILGVEGDPDRLVYPGRFPALLSDAVRSLHASS